MRPYHGATLLALCVLTTLLIFSLMLNVKNVTMPLFRRDCDDWLRQYLSRFTHSNIKTAGLMSRLKDVNIEKCPFMYMLGAGIQDCIDAHLLTTGDDDLWLKTSEFVKNCGTSLIEFLFDYYIVMNMDERKIVILPTDRSKQCNVLTAGVGNDINSEMKLKTLLPNAKFIGADPIATSGNIYRQIGDYHQLALGAKNGQFTMSVMIDNGQYEKRTVTTRRFDEFVAEQYDDGEIIDYLLMDIEGEEYNILADFHTNNPLFKRNAICQINVEIHGPFAKYDASPAKYRKIMSTLLTHSDYLPLKLTKPINHARLVLINWRDERCLKLYAGQWCSTFNEENINH